MTKHDHEMWISSLYLWLVICSQNACSTYLLITWGLYMTWRKTHGLRVTGSGQDTPCHNQLDILSYSAWNSENTSNWWQLLGAVSHFHYSPGPALTWAPKAQGRVSWVSLTPNMWCLSKHHPIPQTPMGCARTQFNLERKSGEVTCILHVESQNCPEFRSQPCAPICQYLSKCLKLGSSINPPPFN